MTSLPAWGVWIEIGLFVLTFLGQESLPAWGVWIEIALSLSKFARTLVTPRMGSVD